MILTHPNADQRDVEGARKLLTIAETVPSAEHWLGALGEATPRQIVGAIAGLDPRTVNANVAVTAFREAARAMVETKLTEQLVEQMERLETVSTKLARAAVWLGAGGLLFAAGSLALGAVQVWLAWPRSH